MSATLFVHLIWRVQHKVRFFPYYIDCNQLVAPCLDWKPSPMEGSFLLPSKPPPPTGSFTIPSTFSIPKISIMALEILHRNSLILIKGHKSSHPFHNFCDRGGNSHISQWRAFFLQKQSDRVMMLVCHDGCPTFRNSAAIQDCGRHRHVFAACLLCRERYVSLSFYFVLFIYCILPGIWCCLFSCCQKKRVVIVNLVSSRVRGFYAVSSVVHWSSKRVF